MHYCVLTEVPAHWSTVWRTTTGNLRLAHLGIECTTVCWLPFPCLFPAKGQEESTLYAALDKQRMCHQYENQGHVYFEPTHFWLFSWFVSGLCGLCCVLWLQIIVSCSHHLCQINVEFVVLFGCRLLSVALMIYVRFMRSVLCSLVADYCQLLSWFVSD